MGRKRDDKGQYTEEVSIDNVLDAFRNAELPVLTSNEVAEALDCSRASAYNKLESLVDQGELRKKKVGARAVVYIRLEG